MLYMYSASGEYPMLAIRLPEEIEQRLADLAAKTGRSKSFYAREAILEHLEELDHYNGTDGLLGKIQAEGHLVIHQDQMP